ncbi:MAG: hypothetical protein UY63_C0009G0010 [Parcubacteria group bacterium GW2011_GWA2_51_10]|nr:MAG: hypothetical protein UY63_C0009G0010 [Parcubacteria group bacterium GW2011_GWA2_51_10]
MRTSAKISLLVIFLLSIAVLVIWWAVVLEDRNGKLTVSFLDVGQGDAIFIDAPSGRQVLIDGGRSSVVLRELSKVMPWYDKTIDLLIPTHPDADHIGGLIDVLARYRVAAAIGSSVKGDTGEAKELDHAISSEGARRVRAMRGQVVDLGPSTSSGLRAYLEILFPDRSVENVETNTGCVVARLVYGGTSFMFSCDAPQSVEKYLAGLDGKNLHANVLKAGHHGSRTSSSELFIGFVDPEFAVFSRGCDNSYGHPHKEVIEIFERFEIPTYDTCKNGAITFMSDGNTVQRIQ